MMQWTPMCSNRQIWFKITNQEPWKELMTISIQFYNTFKTKNKKKIKESYLLSITPKISFINLLKRKNNFGKAKHSSNTDNTSIMIRMNGKISRIILIWMTEENKIVLIKRKLLEILITLLDHSMLCLLTAKKKLLLINFHIAFNL